MFDVLIIGGGAAGVSCALILGSAHNKPFTANKKIGIIMHQRGSALQDALFNNAYGINPGTLGSELLQNSIEHLSKTYPHITQIHGEKTIQIVGENGHFTIETNKNTYTSKKIVIATGNASPFTIKGLESYVAPHPKSIPEKNRLQLLNTDHLVKPGIYVAGTLAGWRSQLAIAVGSGASVATDILTLWNEGIHTHAHDSIKKQG